MIEHTKQPDQEIKGWEQAVEDTSPYPHLHAKAVDHFERVKAKHEISPEHHQSHIDIARPAVPNIDSLPPEEQDFVGEIIEIGEEALGHTQASVEVKETQEFGSQLPTAEELSGILSAELLLTVPTYARLVQQGEQSNVRILGDDTEAIDVTSPDLLPKLQSEYIEQNVKKLVDKAWWVKLQKTLSREVMPEPINILAKHVLEMEAHGKDTEQQYDVFEVGDKPLTEEERKIVFSTLKLIDQFSGGLLSTEEARRPIVFGDISLPAKSGIAHEESAPAGINNADLTYINMDIVRSDAEKSDVDIHDRFAAVIVHEILGHHLEHTVEGNTGDTFERHFDYSEERKEGTMFNIHSSITPKDPAIESNPVSEYGHRNAAEDLATSVEASVAEALGWKDNLSARFHDPATVDSHRRDIVLDLMQAAAEKAMSNEGTPGFVGSEIEYTKDGTGNLRVVPVRQYKIQATYGEDARREEIAKLTATLKKDSELIVRVDEPVY